MEAQFHRSDALGDGSTTDHYGCLCGELFVWISVNAHGKSCFVLFQLLSNVSLPSGDTAYLSGNPRPSVTDTQAFNATPPQQQQQYSQPPASQPGAGVQSQTTPAPAGEEQTPTDHATTVSGNPGPTPSSQARPPLVGPAQPENKRRRLSSAEATSGPNRVHRTPSPRQLETPSPLDGVSGTRPAVAAAAAAATRGTSSRKGKAPASTTSHGASSQRTWLSNADIQPAHQLPDHAIGILQSWLQANVGRSPSEVQTRCLATLIADPPDDAILRAVDRWFADARDLQRVDDPADADEARGRRLRRAALLARGARCAPNVFRMLERMPRGMTHQCPSCCEAFENENSWRRHLHDNYGSVVAHLCQLGETVEREGGETVCSACGKVLGEDHDCSKKKQEHGHGRQILCHQKAFKDKIFMSKQNLNQHRAKRHVGVTPEEHLKDSAFPLASRCDGYCGFCGKTFDTRSKWIGDLADHFKNGSYDMTEWQSPWAGGRRQATGRAIPGGGGPSGGAEGSGFSGAAKGNGPSGGPWGGGPSGGRGARGLPNPPSGQQGSSGTYHRSSRGHCLKDSPSAFAPVRRQGPSTSPSDPNQPPTSKKSYTSPRVSRLTSWSLLMNHQHYSDPGWVSRNIRDQRERFRRAAATLGVDTYPPSDCGMSPMERFLDQRLLEERFLDQSPPMKRLLNKTPPVERILNLTQPRAPSDSMLGIGANSASTSISQARPL